MTNYTKTALHGALTVFVISIFAAGLGYALRFILARHLSVEDFGLFYAIISFLSLFGVVRSLGLDQALVKFIPELLSKGRTDQLKRMLVYTSIMFLVMNALILGVIVLLSSFLAEEFFKYPSAAEVLIIMAIAFFIDSFVSILKFSFQGFKRMVLFSGIDLVRMVLLIVTVLVLFSFGYGLMSPVLAYLTIPVVLLFIFGPLFLFSVLKKEDNGIKTSIERRTDHQSFFWNITKYSLFAKATSIGGTILSYTDTMVITFFLGVGLVGVYNAALPTANLLLYVAIAFSSVLIPLSSELWAKREEKRLKEGLFLLHKFSVVIVTLLAIVMISFSGVIVELLFGEEYLGAVLPLQILSAAMVVATLVAINVDFLAGIGKPELSSSIVYLAAFMNLVLNLSLIPILGIIGAALTTAFSHLLMFVLSMRKIQQLIRFDLPIREWIVTLVVGVIIVGFIELLRKTIVLNWWQEALILLPVIGIVYGVCLFVFRVVEVKEIMELKRRLIA